MVDPKHLIKKIEKQKFIDACYFTLIYNYI